MGVSNTTYKQTELGLIPQDWEVKKISDFTEVSAGGTPSTFVPEYWNGNIRWMNSGELNLKQVWEVENTITELGLKNSATKLLPENCILIGLAGQGKTRGTVAINKVPLCTNQSIASIFPAKNIIPEYLYQNLDNRYTELRNLSTGDGGRGGLNLSIIKSLLIPIPPLAEQTAIANALSDVDNLIESLENLIKKKKLIKQGALQKLLKQKKGWRNKRLGEIGKVYGGLSGKNKKDFETGDKPYIPFMNVMANTIINTNDLCYVNFSSNETQNKVLKNDLIFNGSSETPEEVGMCSVLLHSFPELYLNSFCFGYRLTNTSLHNPLYLSFYFRSSFGRNLIYSLSQGATRYNLSKTNFLNLIIPIPSLEEQEEIADILTDMDNEIELLKSKLHKHQQVKQGMMQNLLTGKIRLL